MSWMTLFWKIDHFNKKNWVLVTWDTFPKYPHPFRFSASVEFDTLPSLRSASEEEKKKKLCFSRRCLRSPLLRCRWCPSQLVVGARHTLGFCPVLGIIVGDFFFLCFRVSSFFVLLAWSIDYPWCFGFRTLGSWSFHCCPSRS